MKFNIHNYLKIKQREDFKSGKKNLQELRNRKQKNPT